MISTPQELANYVDEKIIRDTALYISKEEIFSEPEEVKFKSTKSFAVSTRKKSLKLSFSILQHMENRFISNITKGMETLFSLMKKISMKIIAGLNIIIFLSRTECLVETMLRRTRWISDRIGKTFFTKKIRSARVLVVLKTILNYCTLMNIKPR